MVNIQNIPIGEQLRVSNPKVNQNFQNLNSGLGDVDKKLNDHINSTTAHKAEDISYSGLVPGDDVKDAIDNVNGRISEIVAQAGNDNTEIVDARGGYTTLGDRLNASDNLLSQTIKKGELLISVKEFSDQNPLGSSHIQAALDYAEQAGGGVVYAPPAEYIVDTSIYLPSNTVLYSSPGTVYKRTSDIDVMFINKSSGSGAYAGAQNISLIGGTIDANRQGFPTNCTSVAFGHCTNVLVKGVKFLNTHYWHSLELNAVLSGIVEECIFDGYSSTGSEYLQLDIAIEGAFPWFGPWDETTCKDIKITSCKFYNGIDAIGSHSAVSGKFHTDITIRDNHFYNFSGTCIKTLNYIHVTIENNYIENVFKGITLSTAAGDHSEDTHIIGNKIVNANKTDQARAIQIGDRNNRGVIEGNFVKNVGRHGIGVDRSSDWQVTNNRVYGSANNGIWIYGSSNVVVSDNTVKRDVTTDYDIIAGATGEVSNNNIITNNICDRMGVFQCTNTVVIGNIVAVSMGFTGNTNTNRANNMINGVWTP